MLVSVETTGGSLGRRLVIELPWTTFEEREAGELKKLQKTILVPGFRLGKAPLDRVRSHSKDLRTRVIYQLTNEYFPQALKKVNEDEATTKLRIASEPVFEIPAIEDGQPVKLSILFEVFPEIELKSLDGVEIVRVTATLEESDIDATIEKLRRQFANWDEVNREAANGDRLEIDFQGFIDDVAFEGGTAKKFSIELGSKRMIPGFEDGMLGMKPGEERSIQVTFPTDYQEPSFAGKEAKFVIHLHKIEAPKLLDVGTELAQLFGVSDGSIDTLRQEIREGMERELDMSLRNRAKENTFQKWVELNPLEIPSAIISAEIDQMLEQMKDKFPPKADKKILRAIFEPEAKKRVTLALLVNEASRLHNIKADPKRVEELIMQAASAYENPEEMAKQYFAAPNVVENMEGVSIEEQVIDQLLSTAKVIDEVWNFNEVMQGSKS